MEGDWRTTRVFLNAIGCLARSRRSRFAQSHGAGRRLQAFTPGCKEDGDADEL
jgi:hypothetical protein